jgi:hypothetical protein
MGQSPADSDCGTSSPASAVEKNAHRRFPRLMLPEQSEMNGPIVDAQAQLNPTSEVSAVAQSPPTLNGGRKARVGFSVIRGLTRNRRRLSSTGRPLSLANSAWCTAHQRQGEKGSPSFSNGTQLCRFQSSAEHNLGDRRVLDSIRSSFRTIRAERAIL